MVELCCFLVKSCCCFMVRKRELPRKFACCFLVLTSSVLFNLYMCLDPKRKAKKTSACSQRTQPRKLKLVSFANGSDERITSDAGPEILCGGNKIMAGCMFAQNAAICVQDCLRHSAGKGRGNLVSVTSCRPWPVSNVAADWL